MIPPAFAYVLLASLALNIGLVAWLILRGAGPRRVLEVWDGRGYDVVKVKPGQKAYDWKRPGGGKVHFLLNEEWAEPYGKRGLRWCGNGLNGSMARWHAEQKAWVQVASVPKTATDGKVVQEWVPATPEVLDAMQPDHGQFLKTEWQARRMEPSADYLATALDDGREIRWYAAQKLADAGAKAKPNLLLLAGAAIAVWFFFIR
jgi:hypothetical protein